MAKCKTTPRKAAAQAADKTAKTTAAPRIPKKRVTFALHAESGSEVYVAGDFNGWDPAATRLTDKKTPGEFVVTIAIPRGTYEYKFVINGSWQVDTNNSEWVQNSLGTLNSVLRVE